MVRDIKKEIEASLAEDAIYIMDGEEYCDEERCLAEMLLCNVLFANSRPFVCLDGKQRPETVLLFVNCNDTFSWGSADAESLPYTEIGNLYKMWKNSVYGTTKWCCIRRNEKPQKPLEDSIRKAGEWDDVFENLPDNYYDKANLAWWKARKLRLLLPWWIENSDKSSKQV
jgi:hypothetical protein